MSAGQLPALIRPGRSKRWFNKFPCCATDKQFIDMLVPCTAWTTTVVARNKLQRTSQQENLNSFSKRTAKYWIGSRRNSGGSNKFQSAYHQSSNRSSMTPPAIRQIEVGDGRSILAEPDKQIEAGYRETTT